MRLHPSRGVIACLILLPPLAYLARADSLLFVNGGNGLLSRANLDGSNLQNFSELNPIPLYHQGGISLHENKLYWGAPGNYFSTNLDGSNQQPLSTVPDPVRIKLLGGVLDSAGNAYFSYDDTLGGASVIQRFAPGDSDPNATIYTSTRFSPKPGLAIDLLHSKIYWAGGWNQLDAGLLQRSNLDGSNIETLYTGQELHFEDYPIDLEIDPLNNMIYWTGNMSWIARAPLDGSTPPQILLTAAPIESLALELSVPEPTTLTLLLPIALLLLRRRHRANHL
ncbi:MAG TPA: hypothetical protein VGQ99_07715 [Tepidisphaeraceae bacterium]|nr:hypothetical protein [Tepidisphaeraceae bacterium]